MKLFGLSGKICLHVFIILFLGSCDKFFPKDDDPTDEGDVNIVAGTEVAVISTGIGPGGGTVAVSNPDNPLNGMELTISPNAFARDQLVTVSYSEIKSHKFGEYFNPVSPLITIMMTDLYAERPMDLKIPIRLPAGHYAMAFLYNKKTGELEGMPTEELGTDYIIVAASHFSSTPPGSLKTSGDDNTDWSNQVIVSSVLESLTTGKLQISSGFEVGTDDWEFPNYGSYIAPISHGAGQSATAAWYFQEMKKSSGPLFHRYDSIISDARPDAFWMDNPLGYRFCSVVQKDIGFDTFWKDWSDKFSKQISKPSLVWKNVFVSMIIRRQPQMLLIRKSTTGSATVVICYKIDLNEKKLYIADPCLPGSANQTISYLEEEIGPYISKINAGSHDIVFDQFAYSPLTSLVDLSNIRDRWKEMESQSIGDNKFPSYSLYLEKFMGIQLYNNLEVYKPDMAIICYSGKAEGYLTGTDHLQPFVVYNRKGVLLAEGKETNQGIGKLTLSPGENKIGIYVKGVWDNQEWYVDYRWFSIVYNNISLAIKPDSLVGEPNRSYQFIADINGADPQTLKFVWNFGDGTDQDTIPRNTTNQHLFTSEGIYHVTCKALDYSNDKLIASATSRAVIVSSFLSDLQATKYVFVSLVAYMKADNGEEVSPVVIDYGYKDYGNQKLTWNGQDFSIDFQYKVPPVSGTDSIVVKGSCSGNISADGKTVENLIATQKREMQSQTGYWREDFIQLTSLSLSDHDQFVFRYNLEGVEVESHVPTIRVKWRRLNPDSQEWEVLTLQSIDFSNTYLKNDIRLEFYKN